MHAPVGKSNENSVNLLPGFELTRKSLSSETGKKTELASTQLEV